MTTDRMGAAELALLAAARHVLLEPGSLESAAPRLLSALASILDVERGELWLVDSMRNVLTLEAGWQRSGDAPERPAASPRTRPLGPGSGVAGRAWSAGRALVVTGTVEDAVGRSFPGAVAVPMAGDSGTIGVVVLYRGERTRAAGPDLLDALSDVVGQWGQLIARRRAEDALRESQDRFRTLVTSLAVGVLVEDASGAIETANPAAERILGLRVTECAGRTPDELGLRFVREDGTPLPPSERPAALALREGQPSADSLIGVDLPDGRRRWISVNAEPLRRTVDGRPAAVLVSFVDVTDRRRLEEQLHQARKMEALGQLAGSVAHDFNNLLTPILGLSETVQLSLPAGSALRADLEEIRRAAERAATLTRQLLTFSRARPAEPAVLDPNALVLGLEKLLHHTLGRDVELRLRLGAGVGAARADSNLVEQVLLNLAVNARDAMSGAGTLTIETLDVELGEAYTREHLGVAPGPYVRIAVADTGCGIEPQILPRIFEPFFTTKGPGRGTGLGLAIAYGIVSRSGGHIGVESETGRGTVFEVYLPRAAETLRPVTPRPAHSAGTILLVEDDHGVRTLAARVLREAGYQVLEAESGEEALAAADSFWSPIHLLLTGTGTVTPGLSGAELAGALQARLPGLRVVTFRKTFTPGALTARVREALELAS